MSVKESLKGAELVFIALLTIGLIGLLFLIIYGNLSGNLGFARSTATYTNETGAWLNATPYTITGEALPGYISFSVTGMWNASEGIGTVIPAANYTLDTDAGTIVNASVIIYADVNLSYTVTYKAITERNTEAVIGNLTTGATSFFTFSNVWFILTAITILIGIVLGVIGLVRKAGTSGMAGKKSKSQFVS